MKTKLILAPIRGVTTTSFRNIYSKYFCGLDEAMAPFIPTTHGKKISSSHMKEISPEYNKANFPLIPQLIGKNSEDFIQAANYIATLGYNEVNWNLGCPAPTIRKKQRGSGLIPYPLKIEKFLKEATKKSDCSISVKIRLGVENPEELFNLIPIFNESGILNLTIHPRTALQGYEGKPDIDRYQKALSLLNIPVIYSGDINDLDFFNFLRDKCPKTSAWMIGRGLLYDPFLPSILKGLCTPNDKDLLIIKKFHDELFSVYEEELFGPASLLGRMKELWSYLHKSFPKGDKLFKKIKKAVTIKKYSSVIEEYFKVL